MANPNAAKNLTREARAKGGRNSSGNFKHNPQRAAEAGSKSRSKKPATNDNQ